MNDNPINIVLAGLAGLVPLASAVYWFASTYVTKKQLKEQCDQLRVEANLLKTELTELEERVDSAERELSEGHAIFASIKTELSYIRRDFSNFSGKLDRLFLPRHEPQCAIATDTPKADH